MMIGRRVLRASLSLSLGLSLSLSLSLCLCGRNRGREGGKREETAHCWMHRRLRAKLMKQKSSARQPKRPRPRP